MDCSEFRDDMLDVLYGEADPGVAARFEAHATSCEACREELLSLQGVRRDLQTWGIEPKRAPRRLPVPSLRGLAAAAAVVMAFGAGLAAARLDVQMRDGELAVRFVPAAAPATTTAAVSTVPAEGAPRPALAPLTAARPAAPSSIPTGLPVDQSAFLERVQAMIRESEARQAVIMQASVTELGQRAEAQRRYDLARISAGLSYLESKAGADVARTNELMSHVLKVSQDDAQ